MKMIIMTCLLMILGNVVSAQEESIKKWRSYRFGLFVHWGVSAGLGTPKSHSHARKSELNPEGSVPAEEYDQLYLKFNPTNYNPDAILNLAYDAGMRYTVFVAKHHDGFCMFDSEYTDYDVMATPYAKDVAGMFVEAARKKGVAVGWQVSPKDWKHPHFNQNTHDKYNNYYQNVMGELAGNYGPISVFWFDGIEPVGADKWKNTLENVADIIRSKSSMALLSTRGGEPYDFISLEQLVGPFDRNQPWEMCEKINPGGWIYNKPIEPFPIRKLLRNFIFTISRDGNYLLNVGLRSDGTLYPPDSMRLIEFAEFMEINREAIHGTRGGPYRDGDWGGSTCKENDVYLFISDRVGNHLRLNPLSARILKVSRLDGKELHWNASNKGLEFTFPNRRSDNKPVFTCIKLELDHQAINLPLIEGTNNLLSSAKLVPSSVRDKDFSSYGPANLLDQKAGTVWDTDPEEQVSYLDIDFGKIQSIGSVSLAQKPLDKGWNQAYHYKLQIRDHKNQEWKEIANYNFTLGGFPVLELDPISTRYLRLSIETETEKPPLQLSELRVFEPLIK